MSAAMYGSFVVLFPFYWLGVLGPASLTTLGHLLMLVAMAVAMLHRRDSRAS
jgi:flagellar biosynthetic protein FliP